MTTAVAEPASPKSDYQPEPAAYKALQACRYLCMSKAAFYRGIASGVIPASVRTPGGPRWRKRDLDRYLDGLKPRK